MPMTYAEHDKKMRVPAVSELLPLRDIPRGDSIFVRTNGAFVAGYELKGVLSYFATDDERNRAKERLEALFRVVPDVSMRIQFRYEIAEHLGDLLVRYVDQQRAEQAEVMALDTHRLRMWRQKEQSGFYFANRLHVYFIWDPRIHARLYHPSQKRESRSFTLSHTKAIQRSRREHDNYVAEFESLLRGVESGMEAAALGATRLSRQELFEELKHAQNPVRRDTRPYIPAEDWLRYRSARDQVTEASIRRETDTHLNIDGYLYSVLTLKELPDATLPGMLQKFSTLGFPLVVSGQVEIPNQVKVLKAYKKRMQKMVAAQKDAEGNFKFNPEAEVSQSQLLQVQRDLISSSLKTASLSLSVVVRTSRQEVTTADREMCERELNNRVEEALTAFTQMNGARAQLETLAKRRIFLGTLPGMGETDKREHDLLTPNAADLVPVEMPWNGMTKSPLTLFETPYRQLIPYSMFDSDLPDANGILMASTGGGKTLLAQQLLLMAARSNALISIIESGDSYKPLIELVGSQMIEMSLDSNATINPWDLPKGETKPSNDQVSFLKNLTRHMLGEHTPPDIDIDLLDSVLLEAIVSTYKRCSAKASNPTPLFGDFAAELAHWQDRDRQQRINEMARMAATKLRAWVDEGPYARLFDRPTSVPLNSTWLYFNISKLKNDPRLEGAMSLQITHACTHRNSGLSGRPSLSVMDECRVILETPLLAETVEKEFITARKRYASVWAIGQIPEQFVGTKTDPNAHGIGIVKSASTKIIGKQHGDMSAHREHFHLNETAINQIKAFAQPKKGHSAQFLIAIGEKAESTHVIRVAPTPVDYWITTTYPRERTYRTWWLAQHENLPLLSAYERLAERYPRGLADLPLLREERSGQVLELMAQ